MPLPETQSARREGVVGGGVEEELKRAEERGGKDREVQQE